LRTAQCQGIIALVITVTPAERADTQAMVALLEEKDLFYGTAENEPFDQSVRQIEDAIFASPPAACALLARDDSRLAGIAAFSYLWPAVGLTRSLYLKELYVADAYRRQGVGQLLMAAVFEAAGKNGCSRVEWTTDADNSGARAFYAGLGAAVRSSKIFYRVEDSGSGFPPIE
jgi:GNAT superfamily N-acetyltransferase